MNSYPVNSSTPQERLEAQLKTRKDFIGYRIAEKTKELQAGIDADNMEWVARTMASLTQSLQYYMQFRNATFSRTAPEDDRFLEIQTVFANSYLLNPDYIVALGPAEGDKGSKIRITNSNPSSKVWDEYYTFVPYDEMGDKISECYADIRKAWGKAKQEVEKVKKGKE